MSDPTRLPLAALVAMISVLLVAFELMFQMFYIGPVPVPLGTVIVVLSLPWLVHITVTEISATTAGAAAPVLLWFVSVLVLGLFGPGGDVLLPGTWQSMLLLVAGSAAGLVAFRRAVENLAGSRGERVR